MASTITEIAEAPGKGGKRPMQFGGPRVAQVRVYNVAFGNPYVVGGEDISSIFNDFTEVKTILIHQDEPTVANRREFIADLTNKKLLMFTAFNIESGAVDQSAVDKVLLTVIGY